MSESARTILIVDGEKNARLGMAAYLGECGFAVQQAPTGDDGIARYQKRQPEVVVCELHLSDIDGLSVLKAIRAVDPDIPVILLSRVGGVDEVAEALRLGASDYLVKPLLDMNVLVHSVNRALEIKDLHIENQRYKDKLEQANRELREYVRVLERDQEAARQVQSNLLPITPVNYNGVSVSHKLIPSLYLSGDFIDYGFLSRRFVAFYLTDVSGHGASSAFVTVWLKQLVRRLFREGRFFKHSESLESDPAELVALINRDVMQSRFFCHLTCFMGIIDTHTNQMYYVLAGHLPLPVLISEGKATFLKGKGKPVGIFPNATWEVFQVTLPDDFSLVVFSDGVLEILPPEDLIAKENYLLNLLSDVEGGTEDICHKLQLTESEGAPDDIAILSIRKDSLEHGGKQP